MSTYDSYPFEYLKGWPEGETRLREQVLTWYHKGRPLPVPMDFKGYRAIVSVVHSSGLCNRLRGLTVAAMIAKYNNIPHYWAWEPCPACPGKFDDVLQYSGGRRLALEACLDLAEREDVLSYDTRVRYRQGFNHWPGSAPYALSYEMFYDKIPQLEFIRLVHEQMRSIVPTECVRKRILRQAATWKPVTLGLHVRRTDHVPNMKENMNGLVVTDMPMLQAVEREIRVDPDVRFFFAADNAETAAMFQSRFGEHILPSDVRFLEAIDGSRHTALADAVYDLYCLAATSRLLGTFGSTFSHYAAELGGIPSVAL